MVETNEKLKVVEIRIWMGDFSSNRNVAKYSTRLGQSLSSSTQSLRVGKCEVQNIEDIEVSTNDKTYTFSNGIGKISLALRKKYLKHVDTKNHICVFKFVCTV